MSRRVLSRGDVSSLRDAAQRVLDANRAPGGRSTLPARGQYPHQWNWDSAFIAIGLAGVDVDRAIEELTSLLDGQWENGMVPQIIYNPDPFYDKQYFPPSSMWAVEVAEPRDGPPRHLKTSGITQPPVAAIAAASVADTMTESAVRERLRPLYGKLLKYHRFLMSERDPDRTGLSFQVHPWETGLDNSPRWQALVDAIGGSRSNVGSYRRRDTSRVVAAERPTATDYDAYVYILEKLKESRYSSSVMYQESPFVVQDVCFNAILHRANEALADLAIKLGESTKEIEEWRERTQLAFSRRLWIDRLGRYCDVDVRHDTLIDQNTIATFIPLYAGLPTEEQAGRLVRDNLKNPAKYWPGTTGSHFVIPTTSKDSLYWDATRYWRGPIWINMNWFVMQGLRAYGFDEEADRIRDDTLSLLACPVPDMGEWWFWEYFNPLTGNVHGVGDFSWSAALALDMTKE